MRNIFLVITMISISFSVDYETEIQPIFLQDCGGCHTSNSAGGLNLTSYDNLMSSGSVIPGNAAASSLYDRITRPESAQGDMPPSGSLSQSEIDLIAEWINEGALPEESQDISGCMDSNAITCDDDIDPLYFPECDTCSDDDPCENYYNSEATIDNGLCMYNDVPTYSEVVINEDSGNMLIDWSAFEPPVQVTQYVLMRCADVDGDTDGDGELEHELCVMIIPPMSFYTNTTYVDDFGDVDFGTSDLAGIKYTLSIHYPNNNYWGSAFGYYYYEFDTTCVDGEFNNDDPCMPSECIDGVWYDIVIDCQEQMGIPCENGVYIPPPEGVCCSTCVLYGDLNFDGIINVIDVVTMVNGIITSEFDSNVLLIADINGDGTVNVIDIVSLVNLIIS